MSSVGLEGLAKLCQRQEYLALAVYRLERSERDLGIEVDQDWIGKTDYILKRTKTRYSIWYSTERMIAWVDRRKPGWFARLMCKWLRVYGY